MTETLLHRHYEDAVEELRGLVLAMGGRAEEMLRLATGPLTGGAPDALEEVRMWEEEVNRLNLEVDEKSLTLIARFQPAASDLRAIMGATRMNSDLERIGDQAVNIAQNTRELLSHPDTERFLLDIPRMSALAAGMLRDALDSYARGDAGLAQAVRERDDEADQLKRRTLHELVSLMGRRPGAVPGAVTILLIARNLEKVADHATNLAEEVIFILRGTDLRHPGISGGK